MPLETKTPTCAITHCQINKIIINVLYSVSRSGVDLLKALVSFLPVSPTTLENAHEQKLRRYPVVFSCGVACFCSAGKHGLKLTGVII